MCNCTKVVLVGVPTSTSSTFCAAIPSMAWASIGKHVVEGSREKEQRGDAARSLAIPIHQLYHSLVLKLQKVGEKKGAPSCECCVKERPRGEQILPSLSLIICKGQATFSINCSHLLAQLEPSCRKRMCQSFPEFIFRVYYDSSPTSTFLLLKNALASSMSCK
jgi:hypothetical protein